ncbi:hypothetical protein AUP45_16990 [Thalassospira xiamenensis]|jgi:hypothetical protein|nr:hypothetical protein AUP45_16990 [Thalassospira xiamenensis]
MVLRARILPISGPKTRLSMPSWPASDVSSQSTRHLTALEGVSGGGGTSGNGDVGNGKTGGG